MGREGRDKEGKWVGDEAEEQGLMTRFVCK